MFNLRHYRQEFVKVSRDNPFDLSVVVITKANRPGRGRITNRPMDKQQAKQRLPLFVSPPSTTTSLAFASYLVRLSSFLSLPHLLLLTAGDRYIHSGLGADPAITASRHCPVFSFVGVFVFCHPLPSSRFFPEIGEEQSFSRRSIEEE